MQPKECPVVIEVMEVSGYHFSSGTKVWTNEKDQLHRDDDQPAAIRPDGSMTWAINGILTREGDKPCYIGSNGDMEWRDSEGKLHRENDKPAMIYSNGTTIWMSHGERHRNKDMPALIKHNGKIVFYKNGKRHRKDNKPAYIGKDGEIGFYMNNLLHRDNGPAFILKDGTMRWCINGRYQCREDGGPSIIKSDGTLKWYMNDMKGRCDKQPAVIRPYPGGFTSEFYKKGVKVLVTKTTFKGRGSSTTFEWEDAYVTSSDEGENFKDEDAN